MLLDHQKNYVGNSSMINNIAQNFNNQLKHPT